MVVCCCCSSYMWIHLDPSGLWPQQCCFPVAHTHRKPQMCGALRSCKACNAQVIKGRPVQHRDHSQRIGILCCCKGYNTIVTKTRWVFNLIPSIVFFLTLMLLLEISQWSYLNVCTSCLPLNNEKATVVNTRAPLYWGCAQHTTENMSTPFWGPDTMDSNYFTDGLLVRS